MMPAHEIERIACDDFAKAYEQRARLQVVGLHDPHRPTPRDVDRVIEESQYAVTGIGRGDQLDLDTFSGIKAERLGGVERRVKHGAEVFSEPDGHDGDRLTLADGSGCYGRRSIHRDSAGLDRPGPFFNLGLDESLQIFRPAALAP